MASCRRITPECREHAIQVDFARIHYVQPWDVYDVGSQVLEGSEMRAGENRGNWEQSK